MCIRGQLIFMPQLGPRDILEHKALFFLHAVFPKTLDL